MKRNWRIWDSVFVRRNALILEYAARFGGAPIGTIRRTRTLWAGILPSDREALVEQEVKLGEAGLSARRTSIARLGEEDPEAELALTKAEGEQQQQERAGGAMCPT